MNVSVSIVSSVPSVLKKPHWAGKGVDVATFGMAVFSIAAINLSIFQVRPISHLPLKLHKKSCSLYRGAPSIFKSASSPTHLPFLFWDSFSPSPPLFFFFLFFFWSACLSAICLFKFLLNKMGIASCLFVRKFCLHLLFTSFIFLRYLQQILAGCTICVINKTAVKVLTVWSNCQP